MSRYVMTRTTRRIVGTLRAEFHAVVVPSNAGER
jgi:hypothetical protein